MPYTALWGTKTSVFQSSRLKSKPVCQPAWNHWELFLRKFERSQKKFCINFELSILLRFKVVTTSQLTCSITKDWYALYHHSFIPLHLIPLHSIPLLPYTTFTTYDYFIPLHFISPILFATRTTLYHCTAQLT